MAEVPVANRSWTTRARHGLSLSYRRRIEKREDRLAAMTTDRVIRQFEWGLDWTRGWPDCADAGRDGDSPLDFLARLNDSALGRSGRFFGYHTPNDFRMENGLLRFTSAVETPFPENNTVHAQWFPSRSAGRTAVLVLPHWNSKFHQHVALCRGMSRLGISALRLSLPYHDLRMPQETHRADYAVSANVARTIDATRQAVIDARSCLDWLESQGYRRLGIVGTSLGSCYAFLTSAHEPRLKVNVFNLFSLQFADVVWTGLSTRHIRSGLDSSIDLGDLRKAWKVITPLSYVDLFTQQQKESLFIYGSCDTTFLPEYSRAMIDEIRLRGGNPRVVSLPCGHYTMGESPFKYIVGYQICSFLRRAL